MNYSIESKLNEAGFSAIAGVDEAGRGPLAGPVAAAAVILDSCTIPIGLNDSKKLSAPKRDWLYREINKSAVVSIAFADVWEIDKFNILNATMLAMERAIAGLPISADYALIDGNRVPKGLSVPSTAVVGGDALSLSIAAASIVAKVERDRLMTELSHSYPLVRLG